MNTMFPNLYKPIKINTMTLKNRIISAPSSQGDVNHDGTLNEHNIAYYARKAKGGAALVTVGDGIIHPTGQDHPYQVRLYTDDCLPGLTRCAEEIHKYNCMCSYELSHGGVICEPRFIGGQRPYGPSEVPVDIGFQSNESVHTTSQAMTVEFMDEIADAYAAAAARCQLAGFDMVMLHAAHGWLIGQFFSPYTNKRRDEYGGSIENRCRFPIMVLRRIRAAVGPRFPIELRINGRDYLENGLEIDECVEICRLLEPHVDSFHVSASFHSDPRLQDIMQSPIFTPRGHLLQYAEAVRKAVKVPVTTVGGFSDLYAMEEAVASGKADIIALGRQLLADPDLPNKGRLCMPEEVRPCQRCATCQSGRFTRQTARCAVNPEIGREYEVQFIPAAGDKRRILVAGGGPGGMEAAIVAAKRGHEVTLYEKTDRLGGALGFAQYVPFKSDLYRLVEAMKAELSRLPVRVLLNTPLTPELARQENADVIISAIGADLLRPPFPGLNGDNVLMAEEADRDEGRVGDTVAVIGGGLVGIETALNQAMRGKKVCIIEALPEIARDANFRYARTYRWKIEEYGVDVHVNTKCVELTKDGVKAADPEGREVFIPAETIVIAIGMRPREAESEALRDCAPIFIPIGTCVKPGVVMNSMRAAYDAATFLD